MTLSFRDFSIFVAFEVATGVCKLGVVYVIVNLAFENYVKSKLDGIVGLEFHIKRLEAKSKLSQNKETTDYTSVMGKMGELRLMGLNKRMKSLIQK
ncbi:hypothetical protein N9N20_05220 [Planktomarina temperata]|nr:hypothetical protein [Planktomarina temperata]